MMSHTYILHLVIFAQEVFVGWFVHHALTDISGPGYGQGFLASLADVAFFGEVVGVGSHCCNDLRPWPSHTGLAAEPLYQREGEERGGGERGRREGEERGGGERGREEEYGK